MTSLATEIELWFLTQCAGFRAPRSASDSTSFEACDRRDRKQNVSNYLSVRARRRYHRDQLTGGDAILEKFTGQILLQI